jgi:hypothetical protein
MLLFMALLLTLSSHFRGQMSLSYKERLALFI